MRTLLIDGDGIAWPAAFANDPAASSVNRVRRLKADLSASRVIVAFGGGNCFRRQLWPAYKAGRSEPPAGLAHAVAGLRGAYPCRELPGIEADDVLGILATHPGVEGERVIVAADKDLLSVPGLHHNPTVKGSPPAVRSVSVTEADRNHLRQTLTGDATDGYPGCPGVGPKRVDRVLWGDPSQWWSQVRLAFLAAGLTEADALTQARLARILRVEDYDLDARTVRPWCPPAARMAA